MLQHPSPLKVSQTLYHLPPLKVSQALQHLPPLKVSQTLQHLHPLKVRQTLQLLLLPLLKVSQTLQLLLLPLLKVTQTLQLLLLLLLKDLLDASAPAPAFEGQPDAVAAPATEVVRAFRTPPQIYRSLPVPAPFSRAPPWCKGFHAVLQSSSVAPEGPLCSTTGFFVADLLTGSSEGPLHCLTGFLVANLLTGSSRGPLSCSTGLQTTCSFTAGLLDSFSVVDVR
ncbi:hypothetical protein CRENBAI_004012 [Crenichthys baileyi]|uniref:Uncharacterized protein n=1 Tax=Crenichthys baileyi TaxID=28760 RepID=A0AAV9R1Q0_9TELE